MSWNVLHLLAWAFGLKAALDLRREAGASDEGPNLLFFAAWPMLAACLALFLLRDEDTLATVGSHGSRQ